MMRLSAPSCADQVRFCSRVAKFSLSSPANFICSTGRPLILVRRPRIIGSTRAVFAPRSVRNLTNASRSSGGMLTKK